FGFGRIGFRVEHARFRPSTLPLGLYFWRVVAAGRGPARACCALLRHFAYPLLRAILAVRNLFDVPAFLLLAANLFVARRFVDLRVAIFLASAGVSMENPFSASGACSFSPASSHSIATFRRDRKSTRLNSSHE